MEKKPTRPMTPFDERTVPNELHTLKLLLPYTPAASQPALGMLIKVIELQHTMEYFQNQRQGIQSQEFSRDFSSPLEMLEEIAPYLPPEQANMVDTFRNMMNIMEMVQMMQTFTDSTDTENPSESGSLHFDIETLLPLFQAMSMNPKEGNLSDLLMGMLSPEQKETFEMYQTMFSSQEESATENSASNKLDSEESNEV